ncbi:hypothetical protein [Streptomyces fuscigenes]|uniref:hypothetical protein n=1 Tax=Streptomyces fuscigenes TaxID=1528880 RepID=UPI001F3039DF|nr:hypothetical protein [Streptomyces fuscigenes]MCF3960445.1 hypothetical protein [Streptomyces fuscigenes]
MADSERSPQERSDGAPGSQDQDDLLEKPNRPVELPDSHDPEEPDGVTWQTWVKLATEVLPLVTAILVLIHGNGG